MSDSETAAEETPKGLKDEIENEQKRVQARVMLRRMETDLHTVSMLSVEIDKALAELDGASVTSVAPVGSSQRDLIINIAMEKAIHLGKHRNRIERHYGLPVQTIGLEWEGNKFEGDFEQLDEWAKNHFWPSRLE